MRVASPVGDFPFEVSRLAATRRGITVHGSMGAWPARVEVDLADIPGLMRVARGPLLILGLTSIAGLCVGRRLGR